MTSLAPSSGSSSSSGSRGGGAPLADANSVGKRPDDAEGSSSSGSDSGSSGSGSESDSDDELTEEQGVWDTSSNVDQEGSEAGGSV